MAKYLTKQQVIADFNISIMPLIRGKSDDEIKEIWEMNLGILLNNKEISPNQKEKWKFNKKDLEI